MSRYKIINDDNAAIIAKLENCGIAYWEIANVLGTHENTIGRWMRKPTDEQKSKIMSAIEKIMNRD